MGVLAKILLCAVVAHAAYGSSVYRRGSYGKRLSLGDVVIGGPRSYGGNCQRGGNIKPRPVYETAKALSLTREKRDADKVKPEIDTEISKKLELAGQVDLVFLVDVTGSMSPYIHGVRDSINEVVEGLLNGTSGQEVTDLRLAFVGYRDFQDGNNHFVIQDFGQDVEAFQSLVAETNAQGGGGTPEDVFGGIDQALKLSWGSRDRTRLVFLIADAPAHGCDMHELGSDDYPNGDPEERTTEGLMGQITEMGIELYFGKITDSTDLMIEKFSEAYGRNITVFQVGVGTLRGHAASHAAAEYISGAAYKAVGAAVLRKKGSYSS